MNAESLREMIQRRPFEPFCLRLSNGETHEVRHPECLLVTKTKVIVYYPDDDRTVHLSLIHVNAVETLQST